MIKPHRIFPKMSVITVMVLVCGIVACGSDDAVDENNTYVPPTNNATENNATENNSTENNSSENNGPIDNNSTNNTQPPPPPPPPSCATGCLDGDICVRNQCVPDSCEGAESLGTVDINEMLTLSADSFYTTTTIQPTCVLQSNVNGEEVIYSFSVPETVLATFTLIAEDSTDWVFEIRKAQCHDITASDASPEDQIVGCFQQENLEHSVTLEPGIEYYLVVQSPYTRDAQFEMDIAFNPIVCEANTISCDENDASSMVVCSNSGISQQSNLCHNSCLTDGCSNGDCCQGNTCEVPFTIELNDENPVQTFRGNMQAYTNNLNFQTVVFGNGSAPICQSRNTNTPGQDMVIRVDNVEAGDIIVVDTHNYDATNNDAPADINRNAIYISSTCPTSSQATIQCLGFSNSANNVYRWTAPQDGDFYVTIDATAVPSNDFVYRLCKDECPDYAP